MRALFVLSVILTVVAQAERQGPSWKHLEGYNFDKFSNDFGRNYEGGEYTRRQAIYNANMDGVMSHNADKSQTWKQGVNQFSDWSEEEFKNYNKAKLVRPEDKAMTADYVHQMPAGAQVPKLVDYRAWTAPKVLTGIKNQGACGGCWAFSATQSVESFFAMLTGQLPVLSPQQVTSCTPAPMLGCGGGDSSYGWKYIMNTTGLNEEWLYPFTDFFVKSETKKATAKCLNITEKFLPHFSWFPKAGVTGYARVETNDANATMHALATIGPQSISVAASSWMTYEGGIFQNNNSLSSGKVWGIDHAVQLVGYGYDFDVDMDYWIVRNSWGTSWGEEGYVRLARPADEPCGTDPYSGTKVCGTSGVLSAPDHPRVKVLKKIN